MDRARIVAITGAALLAVTASALSAWWMSSRSRGRAATAASRASDVTGEVEIEIPRGAGPTSAAQVEAIAPLDPGRVADGGAPSEAAEPAAPPTHETTPRPNAAEAPALP